MSGIQFSPFPVLTTSRLILRQPESTDDEAIFAHRSDDIVNTWLEDFRHASIEDSRYFIERVLRETQEGRTILWVLTLKGQNQFMGTVCLWNISKTEQTAETGYVLSSAYHRKGYMQEALEKVIDFGFNTLHLKMIDAYTHEQNEASIKLLLKNNFIQGIPQKPVGKERVYFYLRNTKLSFKE